VTAIIYHLRHRITSVVYLDKVDLKKELKALYNPSAKEGLNRRCARHEFSDDRRRRKPRRAAVHGCHPDLYPLAYALKFMVKKGKGIDYGVLPLEGLGGWTIWRSSA
jgi:hypothetical protein